MKRTESAHNRAQPTAKPRSTSPSTTGSVPPADTTTPMAAAASPVITLTATTARIGHRVLRRFAGSGACSVVKPGVVAGSAAGPSAWVVVVGGGAAGS